MRRREIGAWVALIPLVFTLAACDTAKDVDRDFAKFPVFTVQRHANTPGAAKIPPDASGLPVLLFTLKGTETRDVDVQGITVTLTGSAPATSVATADIWEDDGSESFETGSDTQLAVATFSGGQAVFTFTPAISLPAGSEKDFFVLYSFAAGSPPSVGDTLGASIENGGDIEAVTSSGLTALANGAPVSGELMSVTGRLQITAGGSMPVAGGHLPSSTNVAMLQIELTAPDEDVTVSSLDVTGTAVQGDNADIAAVKLVVDADGDGQYDTGETPLGSSQDYSAGDTVTFTFSRPLTRNVPETWLVLYDFGAGHSQGDTFYASLKSVAGPPVVYPASATGDVSGEPVRVDLTPDPLDGNSQSVVTHAMLNIADGGSTPADGSIANNATDVLMLDLTVSETTGLEAATLDSLRFQLTGGGTPVGDPSTAVSLLKLYRDDDAGSPGSFNPAADSLVASGTVTASDDVTLSSLSENIPLGGSVGYWVALDFAGTASAVSTFTLSLADADVSAHSATAATLAVTGGTVNGRTVTVAGSLAIQVATGDAGIGNFQRRTPTNAPAGLIEFSASGEGASVSAVTFTDAGTGDEQNHVTRVRIYADVGTTGGAVDGGDVLLFDHTGGYPAGGTLLCTLTSPRTISAGTSEDWLVTYDLSNTCPYGRTFRVQIASSSDVTVTGTQSMGPIPVSGTANCTLRSMTGTWQQIFPGGTGPSSPGLYGYAAAYDSVSNRMILHGGLDGTAFQDDTHALSLAAGSESWNTLNTGGGLNDPPNLGGHVAIFYSSGGNDYFLVWGGYDPGPMLYQNNTYRFDLATNSWTQLTIPTTPPTGREGCGAAYDPVNSPPRMLLFGGNDGTYYSDLWELTLPSTGSSSWNQLSPSGTPPSVRNYMGCVLDQTTTPRRLLIHAGQFNTGAAQQDLYELVLSSTPAWGANPLPAPSAARKVHACCLDTTANQLLVFGGVGPLNDLEAFDINSGTNGAWNYRNTTGPLSGRCWMLGVWDSVNTRFVIYGGVDTTTSTVYNDVWSFK